MFTEVSAIAMGARFAIESRGRRVTGGTARKAVMNYRSPYDNKTFGSDGCRFKMRRMARIQEPLAKRDESDVMGETDKSQTQ